MVADIAINGSHNSSITLEKDGQIIAVIELERFLSVKNVGWAKYKPAKIRYELWDELYKYIKNEYGITSFDRLYVLDTTFYSGGIIKEDGEEINEIADFIPHNEKIERLHHESHGYSTFYQSPYEKSLVISFDGGGNDGCFNIYHADRKKGLTLISNIGVDLGGDYSIFGRYLDDIKKEKRERNTWLVYSGKIMGLCAYGKVRKEWLDGFKSFYRVKNDRYKKSHIERIRQFIEPLVGHVFDENVRFSGQLAWDIAATSQKAFEDVFFELTKKEMKQYSGLPICLTGGCALNILLNTRIKNLGKEVFVAPNSSDCGISLGMMLKKIKPKEAFDATYSGIPVLDKHTLSMYSENNAYYPLNDLSKDLVKGKIIGVVRGNSEHGPRALGNRSILCNPLIKEMKDILNSKVKNREWYRPFAPVVRLEAVSEYFEWEGESRWMNFCPKVRKEYVKVLTAITHIDGTARVQTVTKEQNEFLYNLLTDFEKLTGIGVLLNTSFNVDGKPILSTYAEAWKVFTETEMDGLVLENFYFKK